MARHGTAFEAVILGKNQQNRRFDFLHPDNPYNAYYKSKVFAILKPDAVPVMQEEAAEEGAEEVQVHTHTHTHTVSSSVPVTVSPSHSVLIQEEAVEEENREEIAEPEQPEEVTLSFVEQLKRDIEQSTVAPVIPTAAAVSSIIYSLDHPL